MDESPWGQEPTAYHQPPAPHPVYVRGPSALPVVLAVLAVLVVLGAAGVAAALVMADDDPDRSPSSTAGSTPSPDPSPVVATVPTATAPSTSPEVVAPGPDPRPASVLSPGGLAAVVAAVEERTGGTEVFEAVVYPDDAVISVPVDASSLREESVRWDGTGLSGFGGKGTSMAERIDLADLDPVVLERLVRRAARLVADVDTTYVIVRGRSTVFDDDGARISAYASNEYGETAYVAAALDGTVVRTVS